MLACIETKKKEMSWITFVALALLFLKNENTAPIFKSLNIYDEELDNFLMFEQSALWVLTDSKYDIMIIIGYVLFASISNELYCKLNLFDR